MAAARVAPVVAALQTGERAQLKQRAVAAASCTFRAYQRRAAAAPARGRRGPLRVRAEVDLASLGLNPRIGRGGDYGIGVAAPSLELKGDALAAAVKEAFTDVFFGAREAPRVFDSFRRLQSGRDYIQQHPGLGLQHASSYLEGLSAVPFPDVHGGAYPWLEAVEKQADVIKAEFTEVTADAEGLKAKGTNIWVPAARGDALAYGPDWRTLVLQDRGEWEPTNAALFPQTTKILKDLNAPTLEVFFARQTGGTGIKSHTDFVNFVQTSHLGLFVPEGDIWIKAGEQTRKWEEGRVIVCDTSFMHETHNGTDHDRIVLIMRHWHPEVTLLERRAIQFLFECLDNPTRQGIRAAQHKVAEELGVGGTRRAAAAVVAGKKGKGKKGKAGGGGGGFGGFGKPAA